MFQICQKLKRGLVEVSADIKELRFVISKVQFLEVFSLSCGLGFRNWQVVN